MERVGLGHERVVVSTTVAPPPSWSAMTGSRSSREPSGGARVAYLEASDASEVELVAPCRPHAPA